MRVVAMKSIMKRVAVVYTRGRDNGTAGFVMCASDGGSLWSKHREGHRHTPTILAPSHGVSNGGRLAELSIQVSFEFFDDRWKVFEVKFE